MRRADQEDFETRIRQAARNYLAEHSGERLPEIIHLEGSNYMKFASFMMDEVERFIDLETVIAEEFVKKP